jgi:succinyl-diaminopimelate desuccinylase
MGENAIHAAAPLLERLASLDPPVVNVAGLEYRESLNAVLISGGIATNVIPDICTVTINYRFAPSRSAEAATAQLAEWLEGFEFTITDLAEGASPGLELPAAAEFVASLGREARPKFGWTDVARFSALGIPAVNFGPGDPSKAHADDEAVPVGQLFDCEAALEAWLAG